MVTARQLRKLWLAYWRPTAFYGGLLVFFAVLLWLHLGTLTGGYSSSEISTLQAGSSIHRIIEHPLNAPFLLLGRLLLYIGYDSAFWMRAAATLFGLLTLSAFYWLVRYWHGERSAVLGTILFGCSTWFLHTARLGTPDVLLFSVIGLVASVIWLKRTENPWVMGITFLLAMLLLYVPGMCWIIAIGIVWQWRTLLKLAKRYTPIALAGLVAALALLVPLGMAIYRAPTVALSIAGLPVQGWPDVLASLQRFATIPLNLFVRGPLEPEHWLARLPLLDGFCIVMVLLGTYLYARHIRMARVQLVGATLAIGSILISLGGIVSLSIIVPLIYILVAAGLGFMLDRWYSVFPRNVIAQGVGVGLIGIAVAASCLYGLRRYFVAWPAVPATKQVFVIQQPRPLSGTIKE
jgi:hypothetical protein